MKKNFLTALKTMLILFVMLLQQTSMAQNYNRFFNFAEGDKIQSETITTSKSTIQRGSKLININSQSTVTKMYNVKEATNNGYKMNMEVTKMNCTIDADGIKTRYNSAEKFNEKSSILNGLAFMLNKPIALSLDRHGAIQEFEEYKAEMATDTLIAFAGLQQELFLKSVLINFLADFTYNKNIKKKYSWADNLKVGDQNMNTTFVVDYIDEKNTILKFFNSTTGKLINSNSNGTYVIDNNTGIIIEKYIYTISVGYQVSYGKTVYAVSRTSSLVQKNKKM